MHPSGLAGRPIALSSLGFRGLSVVRRSIFSIGFSELTTAAAGWPSQAAGHTSQRPPREPLGAQQGAKPQAAKQQRTCSQQHASLLFVSILSQSKQLHIFFILSEFQFTSI